MKPKIPFNDYFSDFLKKLQNQEKVVVKKANYYLNTYGYLKRHNHFMPSVVYILNFQTQAFEYLGEEVKHILGYTAQHLKEMKYTQLVDAIHPEYIKTFKDAVFEEFVCYVKTIDTAEITNYRFTFQYKIADKGGFFIKVSDQFIVLEVDEEGNPIVVLGLYQDVSHLRSIDMMDFSILHFDSNKGYTSKTPKRTKNYLTNREKEIIKLIQHGETSKSVATALGVSIHTINAHRRKIFERFDVKTIAELMSKVMQEGLL